MAERDEEYYDSYLDPDTWPPFMRAGLMPAPPSAWPDVAATEAPQQAPDQDAAASLFMRSAMMPTPSSGPVLWPDAPVVVDEDPFARAAERIQRSVVSPARHRNPMGPFLAAPPADYVSYLSPVPKGPDWEQVVPGATPWSPLAPPPKPTQWGEVLTGIECTRSADGNSVTCITPGGRQATLPAEGFPEYIGPGQPSYHYYNVPVGGTRADPTQLMQAVINEPTPGPTGLVKPATPEGTINEATPAWAYNATIATAKELPGTPFNQVKSYLTTDQYGAPMMVNVTRPAHGLAPGVVMRYVTTGPSGSTIQNEGSGLGAPQSRASPIADPINNVWLGQSRRFIADQEERERRSRR